MRIAHTTKTLLLIAGLLPLGVFAQRSDGLRFGNFKVSPYVSLDASYDSNIRLQVDDEDDVIYRLSPGVDAQYRGTDWGLTGNAWYSYDLYQKHTELNAHRYGEELELYVESLKGWKFLLGERYNFSNQNDSLLTDGGSGVWRNRHQFDLNAMISYAFSEKLSAGLTGMYTDNWFDSNATKYQELYGWSSAQVGAEIDYALTPQTGLLLDGSYQYYKSDAEVAGESNTSDGFSLMAGFGSRLTERIKYRILGGINVYSYADETLVSPALNATVSWMMSQRWALTVASATYFQPSETDQGQSKNVWSLSGGVSYKPTDRIDMTTDLVYRREENETMADAIATEDYVTDQYSVRYRASYWFIQYASVYAAAEYTFQSNEIQDDWDRIRISLGCMLRY
jgi:outer membrane scaffolding protein for murein synthesis (MipA/OmpV family)